MSSIVQCPGCQRNVKPLPPLHVCPYCGAKIPKLFVAEQPPASDDLELQAPPPPPPAPPAPPTYVPVLDVPAVEPVAAVPAPPSGPSFPERMKANKILAGRVCPGCSKTIDLGDDVFNCQTCNGTMHNACYDTAKCCKNPSCPTALELAPAAPRRGGIGAPSAAPKSAPGEGTKPCPYCGEHIQAAAKKCRFCNEFLNKADRDRQAKLSTASEEDDNLSTAEIIVGCLCGWIACIFGIVWLIQGKKKGGKMILLAIISTIVIQVLSALARGGR